MRRIYNRKLGKEIKVAGSAAVPYVDLAGKKLYVLTTAITSGSTTDSVGAATGDFAVTSHATGRDKWFRSDGTNWVAIGDGGAGFTQGVAVADAGALTSAQITGGESPTEAEFNALQADVAALRTKLNALLGSVRGGAIIAT